MSEGKQNQSLMIPIAIVIAGAIVGAAIFFMEKDRPLTTNQQANTPSAPVATKNIPPVTAADHILGDVNAPIKIVVYTDLECPYCKQFDGTMQQIMTAYPGKVAWVVRNFPLQQLHPNAPKLALAAECVAELKGNDAYWKFLVSIVEQAPINTFFDMTKLTATATGVGVDGKAFDACVASDKYQALITSQFNDAVADGGQGTPFSVLITKNGTQVPVPGSQPLETLKQTIDTALKNN